VRAQYCREHIDKVAEECGISEEYVSDVKKAAKFCSVAGEFSDCATSAILALINVSDDLVRDKAISSVSNSLKSSKHPLTGQFLKDKKLPEKTIKKVIRNIEREVRGELTKTYEKEQQPAPETPKEPEKEHIVGAQTGFTTAARMSDGLGNTFIRGNPLKITPVQLTKQQAESAITSVVRGHWTDKDRAALDDLRKNGELGETDHDILYNAMWTCHDRLGGA
jgi:hypothetical protein